MKSDLYSGVFGCVFIADLVAQTVKAVGTKKIPQRGACSAVFAGRRSISAVAVQKPTVLSV